MKYQQLRSTDKKGPVIVTTLLLMQAGDINPNPGPNNTSCAICDKSVLSNHRATLCNKCNFWYHIECMVMTTAEKESLQNRQVSWICRHCSNPNFDSSLFSNSSIELSNSFSVLSSDDYTDSLSPPLATSSPYKQRNNIRSDIRTSLCDTGVNVATKYAQATHAKRQSLKTLVINFCSIGTYNPYIIIGTETHLDSSVNSSELFPYNYYVICKYRNVDYSNGGVLIAMKDDLIGTHRTDLDTKCEIVWVTFKIQGSKDVTIGAFYRSPQFGDTYDYMNELRESINKMKPKNNEHICLAGNFSLPDIVWDLLNTKPGGVVPGLSKQLIDITNYFGLEQVVREPTGINNILDLFFTSNPTLVERSSVVPGISDHDGIPIVIISCKPRIIKQMPRKIYMYHKADLQALKIDIMKWSDEFKLRDTSVNTVNEMFQEFQTVLESAMNSHIPTKIISMRNQTPWISRRIKRLYKRKQRTFNSYKQHRDSASYETFSKQRKITYTDTRNAHRSYISSICSDSPKRFWSYIKSLKVDNIGIPTLNNNNKLESDNRLKAEILNSQFKSVFTQENVQLPQ